MTMRIEYPAVLYYEKHPSSNEEQVSVVFPDLVSADFPAGTAGTDRADAIEAARDILGIVLDISTEDKKDLPTSSRLDRVHVRLKDDTEAKPYKIEILNISYIA